MFKRIAALALLSVLLASAKSGVKSYSFTIGDNAIAGNAQLKPGDYHIKLDGSQAVLTDRAGNQIDATTKVETADRKFPQTAVGTTGAEGGNKILWIQLGGTSYRVVFQ